MTSRLRPTDRFVDRHIGPRDDEIAAMCRGIGVAGLDDLVDRVTNGSPHVYADIQATFEGAEAVADAAARIAEADREAFEALYREAGR